MPLRTEPRRRHAFQLDVEPVSRLHSRMPLLFRPPVSRAVRDGRGQAEELDSRARCGAEFRFDAEAVISGDSRSRERGSRRPELKMVGGLEVPSNGDVDRQSVVTVNLTGGKEGDEDSRNHF